MIGVWSAITEITKKKNCTPIPGLLTLFPESGLSVCQDLVNWILSTVSGRVNPVDLDPLDWASRLGFSTLDPIFPFDLDPVG